MIIIVIAIILVIAIYFTMYNSFQKSIVKLEEAKSGIDVALTKRFDVLTKLLDIVKQYSKHEENVLEKVIKLRQTGGSINEINSELNEAKRNINILAENYPELHSNKLYKELQIAVSDTEEHLAASRRFYNSACKEYNLKIRSFPTSIIASIKGYTILDYFEAEEHKKADVQINFN